MLVRKGRGGEGGKGRGQINTCVPSCIILLQAGSCPALGLEAASSGPCQHILNDTMLCKLRNFPSDIMLCMLWSRCWVDMSRSLWRRGPSSASLAMCRGPPSPQMTQSSPRLSKTLFLAGATTKLVKGMHTCCIVC